MQLTSSDFFEIIFPVRPPFPDSAVVLLGVSFQMALPEKPSVLIARIQDPAASYCYTWETTDTFLSWKCRHC